MHQIEEHDTQSCQAGLYIEVESVYALGKYIDRQALEQAAWDAIRASEAEGEPITLWPGKDEAIEEIERDDEHRTWLATRSFEVLAGELIADRLMDRPEVEAAIDETSVDGDIDPVSFSVVAKLRLNQSAA